MPAATYGAQNPGGTDPWPIESTLAPLATGGSAATAQLMLADYQAQRKADASNYGAVMEQQHQFAYDQLASQLQQERLKQFHEIAKLPGGPTYLAQGGDPSAAYGQGSPALAGLAQAGDTAQNATNLEHAGQGLRGVSEAGFTINSPAGVPQLSGMDLTAGDNPRVAAEKIKAATSLARAKMGGGGGSVGPLGSFSPQLDASEASGWTAGTYRPPRGQSPEATVQDLKNRGWIKTPVPPPNSGSHGTAAPTGSGSSLQPAPGTNKSTSAARGGGNAMVDDAQVRQLANTHLENVVRTGNPQAYADIKANAQQHGGQIQITKNAQGRYVYQGVQGQY